jgi:hypothetical protein
MEGNTRRIATVEGKVRDTDQNLVAPGTGTFRIFEKRGNPIVRQGRGFRPCRHSRSWCRS